MKLTEDLRTARAAYERKLCAELRDHAARSVQPPSAPQVLDLGWRPMASVPRDFPREVVRPEGEPETNPEDYDGNLFGAP